MSFYFAYGANLDRVAMAQRCPGSQPLGPARLTDHRFRIMRQGYATVVPEPGATVHGLLWDIAPDDFAALDDYEELDAGLYRRDIATIVTDTGTHQAVIYFAATDTPGAPCPGYMEAVFVAAKDCGLPADYLAELRRWLPDDHENPRMAVTAPTPR